MPHRPPAWHKPRTILCCGLAWGPFVAVGGALHGESNMVVFALLSSVPCVVLYGLDCLLSRLPSTHNRTPHVWRTDAVCAGVAAVSGTAAGLLSPLLLS